MSLKGEILRLRISKELKEEAKGIAKLTGETLAVMTRQALREYIDRHKSKEILYIQSEIDLKPKSSGKKVAEDPIIDDEHAPDD